MAPLYDGHDYYKRMLELQEKLRKSEEERIRLEERFEIIVEESRSRHDACINRLHLRYIEFLEEQRTRDERNHKLLGSLDRVDSRLSSMAAKTDRLNVLRKQCEAFRLIRLDANRGPPGSITGDSGIASQNEERYSRRNVVARGGQINRMSTEMKIISSPRIPGSSHIGSRYEGKCEVPAPVRRDSCNDRQVETMSSGTLNVANDSREIPDTLVHRIGTTAFPLRNSSAEIHQKNARRRPVVCNESNARYFQADPNSNASYSVPNPEQQISSLSQQNVPRLNKSQTERMEAIQAMDPRFATSTAEPTNGNLITQYTSFDGNQNLNPNDGMITRYLGRCDSGALLDNSTLPTKKHDQIYSRPYINVRALPSYSDYSVRNTQEFVGEIPVASLFTSVVDDTMRRRQQQQQQQERGRHEEGSRTMATGRLSTNERTPLEVDEHRTTMILENELDRYIGQIRSLHRGLDTRSIEEELELDHEQNTSGDLLNVTLSSDDHSEDKAKEEQLPAEVEQVLALASDLASRSVDLGDRWNGEYVEAEVALAKVRISDEVTSAESGSESELEQNGRNTEKLAKQEDSGKPRVVYEPRLSEVKEVNESSESVIVSANVKVNNEREFGEGVAANVHVGQESELANQSFVVVDELEPWDDLENVEKKIKEIRFLDTDEDRATEKDLLTEAPTMGEGDSDEVEIEIEISSKTNRVESLIIDNKEKDEVVLDDTEVESIDEMGKDSQKRETESLRPISVDETNDVDKREESGAIDQASDVNRSEGLIPEEEKKEPGVEVSPAQDNAEKLDSTISREYVDDPNPTYEGNQAEGYPEYRSQEYGDYTGESYEVQYEQDPNAQYEENPNAQYEQDPNAQYEENPNAQYEQFEQDPNERYSYDYDRQYDPDQTYETDPNQSYAYPGDHDPEQSNVTQDQEARNPEYEKAKDEDEEEEAKSVGKSQDETDEPKKKKDVIKSLLDSDTESTIERNVSNAESDFDFN